MEKSELRQRCRSALACAAELAKQQPPSWSSGYLAGFSACLVATGHSDIELVDLVMRLVNEERLSSAFPGGAMRTAFARFGPRAKVQLERMT